MLYIKTIHKPAKLEKRDDWNFLSGNYEIPLSENKIEIYNNMHISNNKNDVFNCNDINNKNDVYNCHDINESNNNKYICHDTNESNNNKYICHDINESNNNKYICHDINESKNNEYKCHDINESNDINESKNKSNIKTKYNNTRIDEINIDIKNDYNESFKLFFTEKEDCYKKKNVRYNRCLRN